MLKKINATGNPGCTLFTSECTISARNTLRIGPAPEKCPVGSQSYNAIAHNADRPAERRLTRASRPPRFFPSSAQFIFLFFVASGFISDAAGRAAQKVARSPLALVGSKNLRPSVVADAAAAAAAARSTVDKY